MRVFTRVKVEKGGSYSTNNGSHILKSDSQLKVINKIAYEIKQN